MFFEDEKENLDNLDNLDDLELDLDDEADDESISWDELLKDDSVELSAKSAAESNKQEPLKIRSIKEEVQSEGVAAQTITKDVGDADILEVIESDDEEQAADSETALKKDAFEVFGGDTEDDILSVESADELADDDVMDDDTSAMSELDDIESTDDIEEDDEDVLKDTTPSVSGFKLDIPVIAGILLAAFLVIGSIVFIFVGPKGNRSSDVVEQQPVVEQNQENVSEEEALQVDDNSKNQEQIPVLDDKNAKKLKPEKKIVLSVESAGRANPFMPTFDEFNGKYYSGIPAQVLMPPDAYGNEPDAQELMKVAVSGILFDNVKPSAIITINDVDYFVQKGDKVDDYMVLDINRQSVVVKKGTNIYKAGVGERFNQNIKVDGSAIYGAGGARYYTSAGSDYTSASDVEIRTQD